MNIIKCTENYIDKTTKMYDESVYFLSTHINYPKWTYKEYPSKDTVIDCVNEGTMYIVLDNDEVIGAFKLNEDGQGDYESVHWSKDLRKGEYLVIHTLVVHPNYQGKGIAKLMLNKAIEIAKENNYKAIRLDIVPSNTPAIKLYESIGFKYVDTIDLKRNIPDIPLFVLYELNL